MIAHKLHYLTVQDLLWINLQVTGSVQQFDYAKLEDGAYYQYGYGASANLLKQAGRFYNGLAHKNGFAAGNKATAFVAMAAFLVLNGRTLKVKDTAGAIDGIPAHEKGSADWVEANSLRDHDAEHHHYLPQEAIKVILAQYPKLISALAKS